MTVAIRKLAGTDADGGRATYFVYFQDNLWGAVALHNFAEMLRLAFQHPPQLRIVEQELTLKHPAVLELLRRSSGAPRMMTLPSVGYPERAGKLTRQTPPRGPFRSRESLQTGNRAHCAGISAYQTAGANTPRHWRSLTPTSTSFAGAASSTNSTSMPPVESWSACSGPEVGPCS